MMMQFDLQTTYNVAYKKDIESIKNSLKEIISNNIQIYVSNSYIKEFIDKDSNFFNNFCNLDLIFFKSKDCHKEYQDDILFDSAADRKNNNPHFGLHRHLHISEGFAKYFKDIKKEKHL